MGSVSFKKSKNKRKKGCHVTHVKNEFEYIFVDYEINGLHDVTLCSLLLPNLAACILSNILSGPV